MRVAFDIAPFVGKICTVTFADPSGNESQFVGLIADAGDGTIEVTPEPRVGSTSSAPSGARVAIAGIRAVEPQA